MPLLDHTAAATQIRLWIFCGILAILSAIIVLVKLRWLHCCRHKNNISVIEYEDTYDLNTFTSMLFSVFPLVVGISVISSAHIFGGILVTLGAIGIAIYGWQLLMRL